MPYDKVVLSPIFYVNSKPHIGHMFTAVVCDAAARYHRHLEGKTTFFSIGTDEHGLKIQKAAQAMKTDELAFCTANSNLFKDLFKACSVDYDSFIRTSDQEHHKAVGKVWNMIKANGSIVSGDHKGYYSVNEETFVPTKDLINEAGVYKTELGETVQEVTEMNYKF